MGRRYQTDEGAEKPQLRYGKFGELAAIGAQ